MQSKLPQAGTRSITLLATIYKPLSVAATIYHPLRLGAVFANTCNRNRIEEWLSCCILCILSAACIYTEEQRGCIQEWSRIRCQITNNIQRLRVLMVRGVFSKIDYVTHHPPVLSSDLHCIGIAQLFICKTSTCAAVYSIVQSHLMFSCKSPL